MSFISDLIKYAPPAGIPSKSQWKGRGIDFGTGTSPAIIRGFADISTIGGIVTGVLSGAGAATQQALNGSQLQAALDWCASNGKYAELPPGTYDINATAVESSTSRNAGLYCKSGVAGFIGGGEGLTNIIQRATNHPVITLGDVSTNVSNLSQKALFGDFTVGYGASQVGQTQASAILLGRIWNSIIKPMAVESFLSGSTFDPYVGIQIGNTVAQFFFSNVVEKLAVQRALQTLLLQIANSTGCRFLAGYFGTGTYGSRAAPAGPAIWFNMSGTENGSWGQFNFEWTDITTYGIGLRNDSLGLNINYLHCEGPKLNSSFSPSLISNTIGRMKIGEALLLDVWVPSGVSGIPRFFASYQDSRIDVGQLYMKWNGSGVSSEAQMLTNSRLFDMADTSTVGQRPFVRIGHCDIVGNTNKIDLDANTPSAAPGSAGCISSFEEYRYNIRSSYTVGATIEMGNADMTVYGKHRNARVILKQPITAIRTLTVSDKLAASGMGAASQRTDDQLQFTRTAAATGAFATNINDQSAVQKGTTSTAGADLFFEASAGVLTAA